MTFFQLKTLLGILLVASGLTAALSMLALMGRPEPKMSVAALKNTHRVAGYVFAALLVVLAAMGLHYLGAAGDTLSLRGVLHWATAALLVFLFLLKLVVVKVFRKLTKYAPVMGMMLVVLTLVVATLSAGFFIVTGGLTSESPGIRSATSSDPPVEAAPVHEERSPEERVAADPVADPAWETPPAVDEPEEHAPDAAPGDLAAAPPSEDAAGEETSGGTESTAAAVPKGNAQAGERIFRADCLACHHADSADNKIGPGLAGLFDRDEFAGGRGVTRDNVREQILTPAGTMPAFDGFLTEEELSDLIAYLESL